MYSIKSEIPELNFKVNPYVTLILTIVPSYKCNSECAHCLVGSKKDQTQELNQKDLYEIVEQANETDIGIINYSGGEPLIDENSIEKIQKTIAKAREYQIRSKTIITNGSIGRLKENKLRFIFYNLYEKGHTEGYKISLDDFHTTPIQDIANFITSFYEVTAYIGTDYIGSVMSNIIKIETCITKSKTAQQKIRQLVKYLQFQDLSTDYKEEKIHSDFFDINEPLITQVTFDCEKIPISYIPISTGGLANKLNKKDLFKFKASSKNIGCFKETDYTTLVIKPNKDIVICCGNSHTDTKDLIVGNLNNLTIKQAIEKINQNPLYLTIGTYGIGKVEDIIRSQGITTKTEPLDLKCKICKDIFSQRSEEIKQIFKKAKVISK